MQFFASKQALHIYYADKAIAATLTKVQESSNLIDRKDIDTLESQSICSAVDEMRAIEIEYNPYTLEWIQKIAELAEHYGVGNCCEKSCTAFMYLYHKFAKLPAEQRPTLELFNNPVLDHFFVVIGRSEASDSADPRTWNPDTTICDPWAQGKGYAIGEVNFRNTLNDTYRVIHYLHPLNAPGEDLILKKDVLAKANNDFSQVIVAQDCMVLRTRIDAQEGLRIFNTEIPMCYEPWDYPKAKHYARQEQLDEEARSSASKSPRMP